MSELQRLRDRVDQLEDVLRAENDVQAVLRRVFGLDADEAVILGMLYRREMVYRDGLFDVLYGALPECEWPLKKQLDVKMSHLRKKLVAHGIGFETVWGTGWSMAKADKIKVGDKLGKKNACGMHASFWSDLAKRRWANTTPLERSEFARMVARVRWNSHRPREA